MICNECKVFKFELITATLAVTLKNPFAAVEMSPLVLTLIKHLSRLFSESPLNTDTRIIQTLWHVPLMSVLPGSTGPGAKCRVRPHYVSTILIQSSLRTGHTLPLAFFFFFFKLTFLS